jgi:hypothetical protein
MAAAKLQQPKKPAGGGYGQYLAEKRPEFVAKCAGQPISAVSKLAGEAWKALSEDEQAPYKKAFEEAQVKYKADLEAFLAAGGVKQKGAAALRSEKRKAKEGQPKKQKDPNAPKRPAGGAYGCFLAAHRAEFQKECPGSITGVAKIAGEKWKVLPAAEKEEHEKEFAKKTAAYTEAMKSYVPLAGEVSGNTESPAKKRKLSGTSKSTPQKVSKATAGAKGKKAEAYVPDIPKDVQAKADKAGMTDTLKKLLCRDDIRAAGISATKAVAALEEKGGLMHPARRALLGA